MKSQRLQAVDKFTYLGSTLSKAVHIDDDVNARIAKVVQHFTDYMQVFGIEVESDLTQRWKSTDSWCWQHYYTHTKLGHLTNSMPKDWTTSIQAFFKISRSSGKTGFQTKKSWKKQGCRVYILFWTWHNEYPQPMLPECRWTFAKENPLWGTTSRKTLTWWSEEAIQGHPQSLT